MEQAGVALHKDQLEDLIKESTEKANALKEELTKEWGINPACGKQLIEHFGARGAPRLAEDEGGQTEDRDQEASVSGVMKR